MYIDIDIDIDILPQFLCEGVGLRSVARWLGRKNNLAKLKTNLEFMFPIWGGDRGGKNV